MSNSSENGWHVSTMPDKGGIFRLWKTIVIPSEINTKDNFNGAERRWPCGLILRCSYEDVKSHKPGPMFKSTGKQEGAYFHHVPLHKWYVHAGDPSWITDQGYELKSLTAPSAHNQGE